MVMLRRIVPVALAWALMVVLTACAGGEDDGSDEATGTTETEASAAEEAGSTSTSAETTQPQPSEPEIQAYDVPAGSRPHDVAVAEDGLVWYTAQNAGRLGRLDPESGDIEEVPLGEGSRPHGVIIGPEGAPWVTDGGLNAIVQVDPTTLEVAQFPLPPERPDANLNTAVFQPDGTQWFTGQAGIYGRLPAGGDTVEVFDAPRGEGPYGIAVTPNGDVYYASLAGSYLGRIDTETADASVIEPPTAVQGTRRVWADSEGRLWTSQWNAGQVAVYDPETGAWQEWRLPGDDPQPYAIYVDDQDGVWLSDFGANALVHFDPVTEEFTSYPLPHNPGDVRQIHGRPGEIWGAESAADALVVVRLPGSDR
jgi:virginiamycin B lyase